MKSAVEKVRSNITNNRRIHSIDTVELTNRVKDVVAQQNNLRQETWLRKEQYKEKLETI